MKDTGKSNVSARPVPSIFVALAIVVSQRESRRQGRIISWTCKRFLRGIVACHVSAKEAFQVNILHTETCFHSECGLSGSKESGKVKRSYVHPKDASRLCLCGLSG